MDHIKIKVENHFPAELKWSSSFKLIFMLKGNLYFHVGSYERSLQQHDFTFIKPFETYGGCTSDSICQAYVIDILPELWQSICPGADKFHFSIGVLKANDDSDAYTSICASLAQIRFYSTSYESADTARIYRAVCDIIATLLSNYADTGSSGNVTEQSSYRIRNILRYISDNYSHKITLEEIAGTIGFHPQYFSTYFKKEFGTGFISFLNNYRVGKSIGLLKDSRNSILDIALACGFNNHKSYTNAFARIYGCSPREFRRSLDISTADTSFFDEEGFEYLRRFRIRDDSSVFSYDPERQEQNIAINDTAPVYTNSYHNIISIGRASSCLRSDLREQLRQAKQDLNLEYVRIRDIFSDDLFVYYEDIHGTSVYGWRALDEIFDFLISLGVKPFVEIGYMPAQLASKKQYAGWQYHPNVSAPRSDKRWTMLVESFISHLLLRYGKETVDNWLFDFWTSPNLNIINGYWNESMERFFRFYEITYRAVKHIDPDIRMGTPNFSYPAGMGWYEAFLSFARVHDLDCSFLSVHLYNCGDGQEELARPFASYISPDIRPDLPLIKPERNAISTALDEILLLLNRYSRSDLPVIVDDWNVTFFPTDLTRDTCFMAPFILETYFNSFRKAFGMGFASLSDIHEDFFHTDQLYNGGPGLLTYNGIPKASYYAMSMAHKFPRQICAQGNNYIAGKTDTGYEIIVYNMDFYNDDYRGNDPDVISFNNRYNVFADAHDLDIHIEMNIPEGEYSISRSLLTRDHGSSYDRWIQMGAPVNPDITMTRYLEGVSTPDMKYQIIQVTERLLIDEIIEPHGVLHIVINRL